MPKRDTRPTTVRFWEKVSKQPNALGCLLWLGAPKDNGYGLFYIERQPIYPHRYMWQLFNGPIPNGLEVMHKCDTRLCVYIGHLRLGTHQENMDDCKQKGRRNDTGAKKPLRAEEATNARLTWAEVRAIRAVYTGEYGQQSALAAEYGVTPGNILMILQNKTWKE